MYFIFEMSTIEIGSPKLGSREATGRLVKSKRRRTAR